MKKITAIFGFVLLCFSFISDNTKVFQTDQFKVNYPSSWRIDDSGQFGTKVFFFSPVLEGDNFSDNCNIIIQDISAFDSPSLDDYIKSSEAMLSKVITDFEVETKFKTKLGGVEGVTTIYTGKQGEYELKFAQTVMLHAGNVHLITCTSKEIDFNRYKKDFQMITSSYQIK